MLLQACAEKCNLMRLCDKRVTGYAHGVGSTKIIGRVHQVFRMRMLLLGVVCPNHQPQTAGADARERSAHLDLDHNPGAEVGASVHLWARQHEATPGKRGERGVLHILGCLSEKYDNPYLDLTPRLQCCIDLKTNQLIFGSCDEKLPFLPENKIPQNFDVRMPFAFPHLLIFHHLKLPPNPFRII